MPHRSLANLSVMALDEFETLVRNRPSFHSARRRRQVIPDVRPFSEVPVTVYLNGDNTPLTLREAADAITSLWNLESPSPHLRVVTDLVQDGLNYSVTEDAFCELVASLDAELPRGTGPTLDDYYRSELSGITPHVAGGPPLVQCEFDGMTRDFLHRRDMRHVDMDETMLAVNKPLGTTGLGPCIAVGLTGTHQGNRYNALTHWAPGSISPAEVFSELSGVFEELPAGSPALENLEDVQWLVVGGSQNSVKEQVELLEYMASQGMIQKSAVRLTNEPELADCIKSVIIERTGHVGYGVENAPYAEIAHRASVAWLGQGQIDPAAQNNHSGTRHEAPAAFPHGPVRGAGPSR
ncbi:hypothetical protein ACJ6WE_39065 [Streptomyces sp. MMS24-I31]|uniref:hypothetical protein n=1 Tax=Streptomyces sp. MMS24-I31 TaxID=3351563 RepID=UPI003896EEEB